MRQWGNGAIKIFIARLPDCPIARLPDCPIARLRVSEMSHLQVTVTDGRGRRVRGHGLERWLVRAAPPRARGRVAIALVGDAKMRRLNRQFRGADYVTDVLSFPGERPADADGALGDIAIALGVARRQARAHRHSVATELRILGLHGILHLLGYDHETDRGQMRQIEERLRRRAGLPAGLIGRDPRPTGRR
jgi:probable rRNA maturation factor